MKSSCEAGLLLSIGACASAQARVPATLTKPAAISVAISHLIRALGLEAISHHTRRHTGATVMVCNGIALRAVQTLG